MVDDNSKSRHTHPCRCRNTMKTKVFTCAPFLLWITCHQENLQALQVTNERATKIKGSIRQQSRNLLRHGENVFSRKPGKIKGDTTLKRKNQFFNLELGANKTSEPSQVKNLTQSDQIVIEAKETRQGSNNNNCQLDDQGFYGDASDPSGIATVVDYLYQVSVAQGTSITTLTSSVIPEVDRAITTAMLPSFFDCTGNQRRRIQEQDGAGVVALSSQPVDGFVAITCPKIVPDSDCYVGQGSTNAVATGLSRNQIKQQVTEAAQVAMQSSDLLNNIATDMVLDITPLTDDLQTFAPVGSQTSQPIALTPPTLTFAPVPLLSPSSAPSSSPFNSEPTTKSPTKFPSMSFPDTPTRFPANSPQIKVTFPPTKSPPTFVPSIFPETEKPTNSLNKSTQEPSILSQDENKSKEGAKNVDWWAWLLASVGGVIVLAAFFAVFKWQGRRQTSPPPSPNSALPIDAGCLGIGSRKDDVQHEKSGEAAGTAGPAFSRVEQDAGQVPFTNSEEENVDEEEESSMGAENVTENVELEEEVINEEEVEEFQGEEKAGKEHAEEVEEEREDEFDDQDEVEEEVSEEEGHNVLDGEESYHDVDDDDADMYYEEVEEITEEEASQDNWPSSQRF